MHCVVTLATEKAALDAASAAKVAAAGASVFANHKAVDADRGFCFGFIVSHKSLSWLSHIIILQ